MRSDVPHQLAEYARRKVVALADNLADPVLHGRIRLTHLPDPAVARPAVVQVNLDVNG